MQLTHTISDLQMKRMEMVKVNLELMNETVTNYVPPEAWIRWLDERIVTCKRQLSEYEEFKKQLLNTKSRRKDKCTILV